MSDVLGDVLRNRHCRSRRPHKVPSSSHEITAHSKLAVLEIKQLAYVLYRVVDRYTIHDRMSSFGRFNQNPPCALFSAKALNTPMAFSCVPPNMSMVHDSKSKFLDWQRITFAIVYFCASAWLTAACLFASKNALSSAPVVLETFSSSSNY